jgi:hypothetical protein
MAYRILRRGSWNVYQKRVQRFWREESLTAGASHQEEEAGKTRRRLGKPAPR